MPKQRYRTEVLITEIGARIRFLRLETGLSLRELAEKANCSAGTIMQIELGRSAISGKILQKLARGLNVQPFDLLNHAPENNDIGYIVEKMRQDPEAFRIVMAGIKSTPRVPVAA